jgi:beta-glucosidase
MKHSGNDTDTSRAYAFRNPDLPLDERLSDLLSRLTLSEKVNLLSTNNRPVERLGIGEWFIGTEVARGYVSHETDQPSTVFPQPIGMASTFDPELMSKLGEIAGTEARIYHGKYPNTKLMMWGPTVDLCRDPRWGRNEEGYGEDPYLTGQMSIAYTKGMRGDHPFYMRVIPTLKHFCANNNEKDRDTCNSNLEPRTKHEYYYEAFRPAITEGGAYSIMTAYNELSGVPAVMNPDLQTIVKDEWGLGFIVTDGGDFSQNVLSHRFSRTHSETLSYVIKAGGDIMTDNWELVREAALDALKRGLIGECDIDRAIGNSLRARFRLGEFDPAERNPYANISDTLLNCAEFRATNLRAAREGITLLKNAGLLPLKKGTVKVALVGPLADANYRDWYTGQSMYAVSIRDALVAIIGADNVFFDDAHDHVAYRSVLNGKYIGLDESDGVPYLAAKGDSVDESSTFVKHDWGFGEQNLRLKSNGKFVRSDGEYLTANSDTTFGWFVKEILKPVEISSDAGNMLSFRNWNNEPVEIDASAHDSASPSFRLRITENFRQQSAKDMTEVLVSSGIERAAALAKKADVVIVCVGNNPMVVARECFDRPDITLPEHQSALVRAVFEANPATVLSVVSSYPYCLNREAAYLPSILYTSHAGPELGNAVVQTLFGDNNPAGRAPQTWYRSKDDLPSIMEYDIIGADSTYQYFTGDPLYCFGHGLSYSKFEYSDFTVNVNVDGSVRVSVSVKNSSAIDGDEVVQVYYRAIDPRVKRPLKKLCAYSRARIAAGESKTFNFTIENRRFEFWDVTRNRFCVEAGEYAIFCGASSRDIRCEGKLHLAGETIPPRDMSLRTAAIDYDEKSAVKMRFSLERNAHYMAPAWGDPRLVFRNADISGATTLEISASSSECPACVIVETSRSGSVTRDSIEPAFLKIAEAAVPATRGPESFVALRVPLSIDTIAAANAGIDFGDCTIRLTLKAGANILDFRFI